MSNFWWRLVHLEPAVWRGFVVAVVGLLTSLGAVISPDIPDAVIVSLPAVLLLAQALWTRGAVTPNAKVAVVVPDPVNKPNVVAPGEAVTEARISDIVAAARGSG